MLPVASEAAPKPVRFQWDYLAASVDEVEGFALYQRLNDGTYDYDAPMFDASMTAGFTDAGTTRTYDQSVTVQVPPDQEGTLHFVMRAYDAAGNYSADSNEVHYPFDSLPPPAVIRFQLIIDTGGE